MFGWVTNADCLCVCACVWVRGFEGVSAAGLVLWTVCEVAPSSCTQLLGQGHAISALLRTSLLCLLAKLLVMKTVKRQSVSRCSRSLCLCLSRSLRPSHCLPRFLCLLLKHGFGAGSGSGPAYVSLVVRMSSSGQLSRCLSVNMPFAFAISQFSLSLSLSLDFWAVWLMLAHGQCQPSRSRSRLGSSRDNHFGKLLMNDLLA